MVSWLAAFVPVARPHIRVGSHGKESCSLLGGLKVKGRERTGS